MRGYLSARGMASQERAYLEQPYRAPEWVECVGCGAEICEDDAYWEDCEPFCCIECFEAYWDEQVAEHMELDDEEIQ